MESRNLLELNCKMIFAFFKRILVKFRIKHNLRILLVETSFKKESFHSWAIAIFLFWVVVQFISLCKAISVRIKNITENEDPMAQRRFTLHKFSGQSSSPAPHPHNFVMKHKNNFKCATMLHTVKAIHILPGLLVADDCEPL